MFYIVNKVLKIEQLQYYDIVIIEVEVGDISAVDTVLKADTKRLALLEEEKKLIAEGEAGNDSNSERLQAVYEELEAIGAASAEARARRILAVCNIMFNRFNSYHVY